MKVRSITFYDPVYDSGTSSWLLYVHVSDPHMKSPNNTPSSNDHHATYHTSVQLCKAHTPLRTIPKPTSTSMLPTGALRLPIINMAKILSIIPVKSTTDKRAAHRLQQTNRGPAQDTPLHWLDTLPLFQDLSKAVLPRANGYHQYHHFSFMETCVPIAISNGTSENQARASCENNGNTSG